MEKISDSLKIIGVIHSPFKSTEEAPFQGGDEISEIEIYKEFEQGLQDIEGFSHLHIIYWLHKSKGYSLIVQTPWDSTPHGLFATRSPHRPNPIGHSVVELIERKHNILRVKGLDAIESTPVLDIKPHVKRLDMKSDVKSGWIDNTELGRK